MVESVIFLSGANITDGGPLVVYKKMINFICKEYPNKRIIAIVSKKDLLNITYPNLEYIEISSYKRFILLKFYYEYIYYFFISKRYEIELWLSLNDCTPTVKANKRAVYCHNATPLYKRSWNDYLHPTGSFLQSFYYPIFYKINLHKNNFIIVQQEWFRDFFVTNYHVKAESVIVNHIEVDESNKISHPSKDEFIFIYPTKAQPYKNIEVICLALEKINLDLYPKFRVIFTIKGDESGYARRIYQKFKHLNCIDWIGNIEYETLMKLYEASHAMIFSSILETWGLPITEFKQYNKPILLVDLPYARETVGKYDFVKFFKMSDHDDLRESIQNLLTGGNMKFDQTNDIIIKKPYTKGLAELFDLILLK